MMRNVDTRYTQDRELSWLRFNERVLEEARDESVPLMERLNFAAIFSDNLAEFFMVRVGSLHDMTLIKETHIDNKTGKTPEEQLSDIFKTTSSLYAERDEVLSELEGCCRGEGIYRMSFDMLDSKEKLQAYEWFENDVRPILSPQIVDFHNPFPHLQNKELYIMLALFDGGKSLLGILPIPSVLQPFLRLSEERGHYILTEDILLEFSSTIFDKYKVIDKAVISVTRSADIVPEDEAYEVDEDFRHHMKKIVKKRTRLSPVRLEIQGNLPEKFVDGICQTLKLSKEQVFCVKYPIQLKYLTMLSQLLPTETAAALCYTPYTPHLSPSLSKNEKITSQVMKHDVLLNYPYESMEPFLRLISESSADPNVLSIKITIYRLSKGSRIAEYLCAAAENGKQVTVLIELCARFDEQNNISWAERLEEAGCTILYGFEGIKVHSKVCLITRRDRGRVSYITQIGTGNYNEKTAKQYTDLSLITANREIGEDASLFFQNMATGNLLGDYKRLLVSPFSLKNKVICEINEETKKGEDGYIFLKLNSLTDRELIDKLAKASQAGVKVIMNIRGICCLLPGVEGLTDNIKVFSIVGRYLEHARIYCFGGGEGARLYIASADFMTRNTERRVEIACPVLGQEQRERIFHIIDVLTSDNVKARNMRSDRTYEKISESTPTCSCQESFQNEMLILEKVKKRRGVINSALSRLSHLIRRA
ncbi:MAG: polyphosphate kinase 1 [Firmicutes bacterium]|nr:polyphosphate kinase 1 [Bacillota bacterium]